MRLHLLVNPWFEQHDIWYLALPPLRPQMKPLGQFVHLHHLPLLSIFDKHQQTPNPESLYPLENQILMLVLLMYQSQTSNSK